MTNQTVVLELSNVRKEYPLPGNRSITVLDQVNLTLHKGELTAIIGPSGSGKSTLLSLLCGLDRPTSGSIRVMSTQVDKLNESELALFRGKHLGIVFQQFHLMPTLTALENVTLPAAITKIMPHKELIEEGKSLLSLVGLSHRLDHLPKELSGGECQRVAIARSLITKPSIVFADEPTGNLDPKTGTQISDLLFDLASNQKMTLVLVTHNQELAKRCQRILTMNEGKLEPYAN
jgi:putative ABC transport system ATP-binding protein